MTGLTERAAQIVCDHCSGDACEKVEADRPCETALDTAKIIISALASTPEEGGILSDEEIKQAWQDCYGEPLPQAYGLVFGRTVRSRQHAHDKAIYAASIEQARKEERERTIKQVEDVINASGYTGIYQSPFWKALKSRFALSGK